MQHSSESSPLKWAHHSELLFPTLSEEPYIGPWLSASEPAHHISPENMASQADDSSVDGTVSSVGESTWDMIDGDSVASEEVAFVPPQPALSASEGLESVHVPQISPSKPSDVRSASSEASEDEEEAQDHALYQPSHSPETTPLATRTTRPEASVYGIESSYTQELMGTVHLEHVSEVDSSLGIKIVSAQVCNFETDMAQKQSGHPRHDNAMTPLSGKIQMGLKDGGLEVKDTFKLLYCGPKELKSAITQKIGSALVANPRRPLLNDGPASSRVTVVPISSFMDESSPEVVMIESGGFDMIIEECISAQAVGTNGIALEVESGNTLECHPNCSEDDRGIAISAPTGVPDLGIIYLPQDNSSSKCPSRDDTHSFELMQRFFLNCGIPYYVISDIDWLREPSIPIIGSYRLVPHRSTEYLNGGKPCTLSLPIDMTTFLALDASQLHQNLVALKFSAMHESSSSNADPRVLLMQLYDNVQCISKHASGLFQAASQYDLKTWMSVTAILLTALVIPQIIWPYANRYVLDLQQDIHVSYSVPVNQAALSKLGMSKPQLDARMKPSPQPLANLLSTETQQSTLGAQFARKKDSTHQMDGMNGSRGVLVRVIGNSNILVRSFKSGSCPKNLKFETKRNGQTVAHQLQKIDSEYSVLEIPIPDAYGLVEVRIWTNTKPKYNETFEIDFGIPWFSLRGWKDLAGTAADRAVRQLQDACREGFVQTLKSGGKAMDDIRTNENLAAAFEKLAASLGDMEQAALSGSNRMFRRSLRRARKARRQMSRIARKARAAALRQSGRAYDKQAIVSSQMRRMLRIALGKALEHQARWEKAIHKAATSRQYRDIYEQRLRQTQKKLLHAWWKVRGNPT